MPANQNAKQIPIMMGIAENSNIYSVTNDNESSWVEDIRALDQLIEHSYRQMKKDGKALSVQTMSSTDVGTLMTSFHPRAHAVIGQAQLDLRNRQRLRMLPDFIQNCKIERYRGRVIVQCVSRYHKTQETIREYQIPDSDKLVLADIAQFKLSGLRELSRARALSYQKIFQR